MLPSGNANGARTPVWATAAGSTSGPRPVDTSPLVTQRCQRCAGISVSSIAGSPSTSIAPCTTPCCSYPTSTPTRSPGGSSGVGGAGGVPLEVEGHGGRVAVGAPERLVGIVERRRVRLVADRPLLERRDAVVLGPQRLALDDERVGPHRHVEVGDVQERSTDPRQRRPVPGDAADDPVARDQADLRRRRSTRRTPTPRSPRRDDGHLRSGP